ncbi:MAG TPA: ABC transporter permease [Kofleriaceae bacterium]|nr:ABC transporter permease [Kofleriaceae bacterium]
MLAITALFSLDRWQEVFDTIRRNKLRTTLTCISVAWGIFVLVFLLGLGRGLDNGMRRNFARDATNGVWLWANKTSMPSGGYDLGRRITFDNRDYDAASKVKGIDHISGQHFIKGKRYGGMVTKRGAKANSFEINAVHADAFYLGAHEIAQGRFLTAADVAQKRKSVVIGRPVAQFLFEPKENPVGQWIVVNNVPFQVVGVFTDPGGNEQERQMYIPITTAQLAYNGEDKIGMLQFTLGDAGPEEAQVIIDQVVGQLAERHNFDPHDKQAVRVHNNIEGFARFQKLFWMISAFVIVIGLGTLAAGVVGVSNIMMIAVKERTKEIGVRKALGATPGAIIFMIIQEAVFLTGISGLLGLAGGVGMHELVGMMDNDFIYQPGINMWTGVAAAAFLVFAGALAGYFPARAAAKVNPIHALRDQ